MNTQTQTNKIAIFQAGYGVFGIGSDLDEAILNAGEWTDGELPEIESASYGQQVNGNFYYCEISDELAEKVESQGGDVVYDIEEGVMVSYE